MKYFVSAEADNGCGRKFDSECTQEFLTKPLAVYECYGYYQTHSDITMSVPIKWCVLFFK